MPAQTPIELLAAEPDQKQLAPIAYSIPGAVEASGLSRSTLYNAIASGELVARKRGARTIIIDDDLRRFLASLPTIAPKAA